MLRRTNPAEAVRISLFQELLNGLALFIKIVIDVTGQDFNLPFEILCIHEHDSRLHFQCLRGYHTKGVTQKSRCDALDPNAGKQ